MYVSQTLCAGAPRYYRTPGETSVPPVLGPGPSYSRSEVGFGLKLLALRYEQ